MTLYHRQLGAGPDLVLLHGWGMNGAVWEPLLPGLSAHFRLTIPELPGHGGSAPLASADLAQWAAACLAVAPPRAYWLGWSLGGQVALQAALSAAQRVRGLTLVAATPRFVQADDWDCAMPTGTFRQFAAALGDDPNATLMRFLGLQVSGAEHARETLRLLRAELTQRPPASRVGLEQGLALLLETDLRPRLAELACPTHWLFGGRDTLVPPTIRGRIREALPPATVDTIDGAGHAPFLSHPQESLRTLLRVVGEGG
jgi:pimeloyl-[acyl-carrier protein] methyl ester esterase